ELRAVRIRLAVARFVALGEQRVARPPERRVDRIGIAARHVADLFPLPLQLLDVRDRPAPPAFARRGIGDRLRARDQRLLLAEIVGLFGATRVDHRLATLEEAIARGPESLPQQVALLAREVPGVLPARLQCLE